MWLIYVSLCLGVLIGAFNILPKKALKIADKLMMGSIFVLLFVMGLSIGLNKEVIKNIRVLGLTALLYAVLAVTFSIFVAYLFTRRDKRGEKECE